MGENLSASTVEEIEAKLKTLLSSILKTDADPDTITPDVALVRSGLSLDSVTLLEFIVAIEGEWGLLFDDGALKEETFSSLHALALAVESEIRRQKGR